MVDRVVERTDGTTSERVTETSTAPAATTVVERRGSGAGLLVGLAVLILVVIGAIYLINQNNREAVKTDAITGAAESVGDAAESVGDAAKDATKKAD
jgi:uncharacterized protein HemX